MGLHDDRPGQRYLEGIEGRVVNFLAPRTCLFSTLAHNMITNAGNSDGLAPNFNDRNAASDIHSNLGFVRYADWITVEQVIDDSLGAFKGLVSPISVAKQPVCLVNR